jgi:hypothetical protein
LRLLVEVLIKKIPLLRLYLPHPRPTAGVVLLKALQWLLQENLYICWVWWLMHLEDPPWASYSVGEGVLRVGLLL